MAVHVGYQAAARCTTGPQPGARALMAWFLGAYAAHGGKNLGIFNCRAVRGGTTTSLHGEGRACDLGITPHGAGWGDDLAELLRAHSAELGIQCLIWKRRIWSGSYPDAGWRAYTGVNPHVDHIHLELSWDAARTLTAARVAQVLAGAQAPTAGGRPTLREGATGEPTGALQRWLNAMFPAYSRIDLKPKRYGPQTIGVVREWQRRSGLVDDGVFGPASWAEATRQGFRG
jgi:hypothetical protein